MGDGGAGGGGGGGGRRRKWVNENLTLFSGQNFLFSEASNSCQSCPNHTTGNMVEDHSGLRYTTGSSGYSSACAYSKTIAYAYTPAYWMMKGVEWGVNFVLLVVMVEVAMIAVVVKRPS